MAHDEYDWLDDAFAQPENGEGKCAEAADSMGYDWIDDAFDEAKEDPLARKGMTGCSSLAVLFCGLAVVLIICFLAFCGWNIFATFSAAGMA